MTYCPHKCAAVLLAAVTAMFFGTVPVAADPVVINGTPKDGFARLKFTWPSPVPFVARIVDKQLRVQFARPVESNFKSLPGNLSNYIGRPELSDSGNTVIFPIKNEYGLNFNSRGSVVTVDLMDLEPSSRGPRVSASKKAVLLEKVKVRTGQHADYGRMVFDWKNKVPYRLNRLDNKATLIFGRAANIDLAAIKNRPVKNIGGFESSIRGEETVIVFELPSASRLRHFGSGAKIIVDVFSPTERNHAGNPQQSSSRPHTLQTWAVRSSSLQHRSPALKTIKTQENNSSVRKAVKTRAASNIPTEELSRATAPATKQSLISLGISRAKAQTAAPKSLSRGDPAAAPSTDEKTVTIRLDWTEPVAGAIFRRADALWIVFDKFKRFDMAQLKENAKGAVLSADQVSAPRGTFLRLSTPPGINPSIRRDGYTWILDFKKQPIEAQTPIETVTQRTVAAGSRLFMPVIQAGEPLPFHDASVGDNLVIIPVIPVSKGIKRQHIYPQVRLLPTVQGIVIQPKIDDLRVRSTSKGVQVFSASKLSLSPPDPKAAAKSRIATFSSMKLVFKPDVWRLGRLNGMVNFNKHYQGMMASIANSRGDARQKARIELAQYLFGLNLGYEALAVLRRIRDANPNIEASAGFRLLRGGSNFLIGRYAEAKKDLDHPSLNESDEGQFWRAINLAGGGALVEAAATLKKTGRTILSYPKRIKMPLGLLLVNAAIKAGDVGFATNYLQIISEDEPTPKEVDQLALVEGKLQQLVGEPGSAIEAWKSVAEGEHRPSIAEAILRRVELELLSKKIKTKKAIEELERVRYSWRGDDLELELLWKLGRYYFAVEDYKSGLRTLRSAGSQFGGHPNAPKIAEDMSNAFVSLYLKDAADSMPAVQAIALFEEFRELTPPGEQGDIMIQKLADRLAQVDLLDKAAKLLTQQVDFRLKGQEKARVGARLATIRLINKQPAMALDAITSTDESDIPPYLQDQRRQLLARSLIDQGMENKALEILDTDNSLFADLLRAEIYWKAQAWPQTSRTFRRLLQSIGAKPNQKLNRRQAIYVINYAVSMALGGDERGTAKILREYGAAMDKTIFKDAFRLIASNDATGLIDFRSVANKVKIVSNFTNFMASIESPAN